MEVIFVSSAIRCNIFVRPMSLLLGVLYKLQERTGKLKNKIGAMISTQSKDIVNLIGYYWHLTLAAHTIRSGTTAVDQEQVLDVVYQNKYQNHL